MAFWSKNKNKNKDHDRSSKEAVRLTAEAATQDNNAAASEALAQTGQLDTSPHADADQNTNVAPEQLPIEQRRKIATASKLASATFGEVVSIFMRSARYRSHTLADLEWLVLPALQTRQFSLAEAQAKSNGLTAPLAVVLWACVSDEIAQQLAAKPEATVKLDPQHWQSGDIVWIVEAIGDARVVQAMLKRLQNDEWSGKTVKLRAKDRDGRPTIATLKTNGPAATVPDNPVH